VGFPGETEDEFEETLSLVETARYDAAYTFQYSSRPLTEAASLPDHLPKEVVQERYDRLASLQERISFECNQAVVGRTEELLVEGPSKKDPGKLTGRTRGNKLVHFPGGDIEEGSFVRARIVAARTHFLEGDLLDVTTPAVHRGLSLPLVSAGGCASCA
jgi:tRNA-2-methylthio-N6-dimethylallyladenosine synthase